MREQPLKIVGSSKFGRYKKISSEDTYNMIISDGALVPFAGYELSVELDTTGVGRELFNSSGDNHMYAVIGSNVYRISPGFSHNKIINDLATSTGPIYIADNGIDKIVFVDGTDNLYIYDYGTATPGYTKVTNTVATYKFKPIFITFQDGYFIIADGNGDSNEWRISGPNDPQTWPVNSGTGQLQTRGDRPKAVLAFRRQMFVIGNIVSEIWHDVGNTLFPYQRDNSLAINYGVVNPQTIDAEFDIMIWLGSNQNSSPTLVYSNGGPPIAIATDGIESLLDSLSAPEDSSGFLFEDNGHIFYQLSFPTDNVSIVYDFTTKSFFRVTDENLNYHIATRAQFFEGKNYFISNQDGNLYQFGTEFTKYAGNQVPRIRITPPYRKEDASRFLMNNVSITMEQGASAELQRVGLSLSKDGGASFGNIWTKDLNSLGNYKNRLQYWNLGSANDITFKFQFYSGDNVPASPPVSPSANDTERFVVLGASMRSTA